MTNRRNVLSLAFAILIGGLAIHGLFVACSGSGGGSAGAQSAGSCQQWAFFERSDNSDLARGPLLQVNDASSGGYVYTYLAPQGWEPIGNGGNLSATSILFRRCVQ